MKVSIDNGTHRLVCDPFHLIEQHPCRRGRNVIVHNSDVVIINDNGGVANHRKGSRSDRVIDAVFHFVEPERFPIVKGTGRYTLRLRRSGYAGRELKKRYRHNDQNADDNQPEPGHFVLLWQ